MHGICRKAWLTFIVLLLIAAQTSAVVHAYEHNPGKSQDLTCSACVTAANLLSGCVDNGATLDLETYLNTHFAEQHVPLNSTELCIARQRGPPISL